MQPSECSADVQKLGRCRRVLVLKSGRLGPDKIDAREQGKAPEQDHCHIDRHAMVAVAVASLVADASAYFVAIGKLDLCG